MESSLIQLGLQVLLPDIEVILMLRNPQLHDFIFFVKFDANLFFINSCQRVRCLILRWTPKAFKAEVKGELDLVSLFLIFPIYQSEYNVCLKQFHGNILKWQIIQ